MFDFFLWKPFTFCRFTWLLWKIDNFKFINVHIFWFLYSILSFLSANPSLFFLCDRWKILERVSLLFETCEKNPFLNNQNNFFYEINLKNFYTRCLETYNNSVFSIENKQYHTNTGVSFNQCSEEGIRLSIVDVL